MQKGLSARGGTSAYKFAGGERSCSREYSVEKFIESINDNYNDQECPVCKGKEWGTLPVGARLPVGDGGQAVPTAIKFCSGCGFGRLFIKISKTK